MAWLENLMVKFIFILSTPSRQDRRNLLQLDKLRVNHSIVMGPTNCTHGYDCCRLGWYEMINRADKLSKNMFPILMVEDDIIFDMDNTRTYNIPEDAYIISLASKNCTGSGIVHSNGWKNWGTAALLFTKKNSISFFKTVTKVPSRHKHIDMMLYQPKFKHVYFSCPPLLKWRDSYSNVTNVFRSYD